MADFSTTADALAQALAATPAARDALREAIGDAVAVVNQYAPGATPLQNADLGDFLNALRAALQKLNLESSGEITNSVFGSDGGGDGSPPASGGDGGPPPPPPPPVGSVFGSDGGGTKP